MSLLARSPYATNVDIARQQPVPFSHQHHVNELGIDCRYCHTSVEDSAFAGIPPTKTCMNCHRRSGWAARCSSRSARATGPASRSPGTASTSSATSATSTTRSTSPRASAASPATAASIRCRSMWQEKTLLMEWCLDCHRQPEKYVRPRERDLQHDLRAQDPRRGRSRPSSKTAMTTMQVEADELQHPVSRRSTTRDHGPR